MYIVSLDIHLFEKFQMQTIRAPFGSYMGLLRFEVDKELHIENPGSS